MRLTEHIGPRAAHLVITTTVGRAEHCREERGKNRRPAVVVVSRCAQCVLLKTKLSKPEQGLGHMCDNLDSQYIFRQRTNPG
jgi:hypothetical protein